MFSLSLDCFLLALSHVACTHTRPEGTRWPIPPPQTKIPFNSPETQERGRGTDLMGPELDLGGRCPVSQHTYTFASAHSNAPYVTRRVRVLRYVKSTRRILCGGCVREKNTAGSPSKPESARVLRGGDEWDRGIFGSRCE